MINYNNLFIDLFDNVFTVDFNNAKFTANYTEGDLFELWRDIQRKEAKYPIIWLQSGYKVDESTTFGNRYLTLNNMRFFIITKGDVNDYYKTRYRTTFNDILYVLKEKLISTMLKNGFILSDEISHITFPFNDMNDNSVSGMKLKPQTATITDIWDAIQIDIPKLEINSDCFQNYLIKKV